MPPMTTIGLECLKTNPPPQLKGKRLGLLANPASVDKNFVHAKSIVDQTHPGQLTALFSPQHGFHAEKQDNMIESDHGFDPVLKIPIFSLYSRTRIPTPEMFDRIDTLVVDIQDVGTRVYTFIYTIAYCMETAARLNKSVVVLDRPNPIGGRQVEGNILEPQWVSFVGRFPIPMRHGMTVGEIADFFNQAFNIGCDLTVVPMIGWKRDMYWQDTNRPWVPPSPNLPTPLSCMVYPGQVILEGTNISEGRGTTLPFEVFGAPYITIDDLALRISDQIEGAVLRPVNFQPVHNKWQERVCKGFHIHITNRWRFKPYFTSLLLVQAVLDLYPEEFEFKAPPYEYEYERLPMDLILGSRKLRKALVNREDLKMMEAGWQNDLKTFQAAAGPYHLYP